MRSSSETEALFAILGKSATPAAAAAIEALARDGSDRDLNRVNALDFAAKRELDEEGVIAAFLHATRLGLFDMAWNVLCPGCGGVMDSSVTLKSVRQEEYACSLCAAGYEPNSRRNRRGDVHGQSQCASYRGARAGHATDDAVLSPDFLGFGN